jgi:hypothetical protein
MASPSGGISVQGLPWPDLLTKVREKECVPFIGAGASLPVLPRAAELAKTLIGDDERTTGRSCPLTDQTDLAKVCQYLAVTHTDSRWPQKRIVELFEKAGAPDFNNPAEPHRALANLRLPIYMTTNYDDFMYRALQAAGAKPRQEFARWTRSLLEDEDSSFDSGYRPTPEEPVVFHLHGHTKCDASMVASEDDYLDFLVTISKELAQSKRGPDERTILPPPIRRAIKYNQLLFIGYGLADINFRVILRSLVGSLEPSARRLHISVQYSGRDPQELEAYIEQYFRWTLELNVFWGSAGEFASELARRWAK